MQGMRTSACDFDRLLGARHPTDGRHAKLVLQHREFERSRVNGLGRWEASRHLVFRASTLPIAPGHTGGPGQIQRPHKLLFESPARSDAPVANIKKPSFLALRWRCPARAVA
jgi:hypothetical protein